MHETADQSEDRFMVIAGTVTGTALAVVFMILATFVLAWRGVKWMTLQPLGLYRPAPPM
jgi:hypothetical protein